MANAPQFKQVTNILYGMAEKMSRLEADPEVKKAADYWMGELAAKLGQTTAVNFARGRGGKAAKPEGGK